MPYRIAADGVVLIHFGFILFVVFGGLVVLKWRFVAWLHVPAALWGSIIELAGWPCPLTPLEHFLRVAGGGGGYDKGFVEHYLIPVIYPSGLTPGLQTVLGIGVIAVNAVIYGGLWFCRIRNSRRDPRPSRGFKNPMAL
jgi:Protein of Unknown function (DUF2784)